MEKKRDISIFCDFDGTIATKDIGNEIVIACGEFQPWNDLLKAGKMDIKDYWRKVLSTMRLETSPEEFFREFVKTIDIDANFGMFVAFCRENDIKLSIISDGFKNYILPFLEYNGIDGVKVYANEIEYTPSGLIPHYYGASDGCECMCASCKRNTILSTTPPDDIIAYIGDGFSDLCGAEHSDIVFAKQVLSHYCNEKKIPHYNFKNFFDVTRIFRNIIGKNDFRVRHQAFLARKHAFECE
ncbi:MAG: MtnX-like HAD-IB family phosphatase [Candidatus Kapabacteria bacterium]|nr:MtnX-like HAD-IB family phosphatase [Candidatus Kapabacteria bacterium]